MKVKLTEGLSGDRFSFKGRQVIECSEGSGRRLVAHGIGVEAPEDAEADGVLHDEEPFRERRGRPAESAPEETAALGRPEAAVTARPPAHCRGKTRSGNPCMKAPAPGSDYCQRHQPEK